MTIRPCLSAEEIADFIRGLGTDDSQHHIDSCEACARRVSFVRRVREAGLRPIADLTSEVDDLVANLVAAPRKTWWKIVLEPEYRRADVARRLLSLSFAARLRNPQLAVDYARAATAIVDRIEGEGVADLRFEVWKFASVILREAARYAETEVALETAEAAARAASDPQLAQASISLSRALFCIEADVWRPEEAEVLLDRAEQIIVQRAPERMQGALTVRALLLFRSGDISAARQAFDTLLHATPRGDRELHLDAASNLMWTRVELREADEETEQAVRHLLDENTALGRKVQVARALWMIGRIATIRGEYERAVESLRAAMASIGDSDTSVRVGLDMVEALLLDESYDEALRLARELATIAAALDEREPSRRRALTAQVFAYLREAAHRHAWTAELVADLGRYIDRITRQRPFDFIPPMPLSAM
jgi:tetratricopeptide (TPR) repeat protein